MHIKEKILQNGRAFRAIYECGHCKASYRGSGYDDDHFHNNVIPNLACEVCGEKASNEYQPASPFYKV